jgi:hypothetical protein
MSHVPWESPATINFISIAMQIEPYLQSNVDVLTLYQLCGLYGKYAI